ncbi:hypothetical protein [Bacillus sp. B1-b2]|uniref:hypothetical protein n=1 Tax=Bacillus sp. B1-b2 TaxID=2653201 RepID=UPI0012623657|nr:hypothetical protein [Bacillus sp. B1-b2]KAB7672669.1 hypothetical protein F9279_03340 [Bacillus sp. B1-b2]
MELVLKKKKRRVRPSKNSWAGLLSFCFSLVSLVGVNISLIVKVDVFPEFVFFQLPTISIILGLLGLVLKDRANTYAIIGIILSLFIFIFFIMMFGLAWTINPKP